MNERRPPILKSQQGIALFLVLWVLTLLMVIVGEFCYTMRTEMRITRNFMEQAQAKAIAEAGLFKTIAGLLNQKGTTTKLNTSAEDDPATEVLRININPPPTAFGDGAFRVRIDNESGKINLNMAESRLLRLAFAGLELDPMEINVIIDSIIDWRDADHLHRLNGAEDDYYRNLAEPYDCKDAPFDSIDELLLVRGMTQKIMDSGLRDILTVLSPKKKAPSNLTPLERAKQQQNNQKNKDSFDYQKICLNAASKKMLLALPLITEELAQDILAFREEKDFATLNELNEIIGPEIYRQVLPYLNLQLSPYYKLTARGEITDSRTRKTIHAMVILDEKSEKLYRLLQWIE